MRWTPRTADPYRSPYRYRSWASRNGRGVLRAGLGFGVLAAGLGAAWTFTHPDDGAPAVARTGAAMSVGAEKLGPVTAVAGSPVTGSPVTGSPEKPVAPTDVATAPAARQPVVTADAASPTFSQPRTFSPASPLFAQSAEAAAAPAAQATWPAVVAAVPSRPVPAPLPAVRPGQGEAARVELIRSIQKELKRVGCYDGEATGAWTPATSRAMGSFVSRSNASLPVDKPDVVHLALLKGDGQPQGHWQGCQPDKAIIAAPAGVAPISQPATTPAHDAARKPPLPGAMAVGGPRAEDSTGEDEVSPSLTNPPAAAPSAPAAAAVVKGAATAGKRIPAPPTTTKRHSGEARHAGTRSGTRHVQELFTHPLGR